MRKLVLPKISDSPLECSSRKGEKCSAPTSARCDREYVGYCCAFCPKRKKCWDVCPKVMSYFQISKESKKKIPKEEKKEFERVSRQIDFNIIGNPSQRKRKEEKKENESEN